MRIHLNCLESSTHIDQETTWLASELNLVVPPSKPSFCRGQTHSDFAITTKARNFFMAKRLKTAHSKSKASKFKAKLTWIPPFILRSNTRKAAQLTAHRMISRLGQFLLLTKPARLQKPQHCQLRSTMHPLAPQRMCSSHLLIAFFTKKIAI
jgi:hypothetical protein